MPRNPLFAEEPDEHSESAEPAADRPVEDEISEHEHTSENQRPVGGLAAAMGAGPSPANASNGSASPVPVTPPPEGERSGQPQETQEGFGPGGATEERPDGRTERAAAVRRSPAPAGEKPEDDLTPAERLEHVYRIREGRYEPDTFWTRLRGQITVWSKSDRERSLDRVDRELSRLRTRGVRAGHLVAVGSAKGGTGKDSLAVTLADIASSSLRTPTLVLDGDWDFGTLGGRAPQEARSVGTILDVYEHRENLVSPAQLEQYVSRMPSGCHLLSAPSEPEDMERLKIAHYEAVVEALRRFYSLIFVTMAPGVMDDICKWAFGAADQIVFVTDSRLVTADQTLRALPLLKSRHPNVPLQLVINQVPSSPTAPQRQVIDAQAANGISDTTLQVPWDERLEAQLDSGTLDPDDPDLATTTRLALKEATLSVVRHLA